MKIVYVCDKTACGGRCPNPECFHTEDAAHAVNAGRVGRFYPLGNALWEVLPTEDMAYYPAIFFHEIPGAQAAG